MYEQVCVLISCSNNNKETKKRKRKRKGPSHLPRPLAVQSFGISQRGIHIGVGGGVGEVGIGRTLD
jgi:hypothetical protein